MTDLLQTAYMSAEAKAVWGEVGEKNMKIIIKRGSGENKELLVLCDA